MKTYEDWEQQNCTIRNQANANETHIEANILKLKDLGVFRDCLAFKKLKDKTAKKILKRITDAVTDARMLEWYCSLNEEDGTYHEPYIQEYQGIYEIVRMLLKMQLRMKDYCGID